ncbi:type II toxin-antitoxin system Phd/YefM family antitoxin [Endozoicomonas sp. GU-1]|uniref:type II toxin-antitoxin system Phd/YefM family antitoxin n=1 Tax=Endozoicomonas sp. GU-1 TaxID=3009078 RepID=UPI0022B5C575|nr:type II toxin-antitoxin system Phd/YefM family antitoxin [Endozoicomonas sp. GU-1]WBA82904.1 type II toxin-antitoxin system Phd/YefM family antitoxin [Endozoicomonas sp. GU-1]WBA85831.1 type II toxin-antitoxin system Phd/YefM family antitoxin [Endozoicomonas sp. GU-1]
MKLSQQVKPISYLKANAAEVLNQLQESREPLVITQNGEAKAVIQDIHSYEALQEDLALLKLLALGKRQLADQNTITADSVMADIDQLLEDDNPESHKHSDNQQQNSAGE